MRQKLGWTLALASVLCVEGGTAGCRDKTTQPRTNLPPAPGNATLESLWPHADSTSWYFVKKDEFGPYGGGYYPDSADVPPATMLMADTLLARHPVGTFMTTPDSTLFTQQFLGTVTTASGAVGQALVWEDVPWPGTAPARPGFTRALPAGGGQRDPLLERLWWARPDLRSRLPRPMATRPDAVPTPPLFIRSYAWASTPDAIVSYGDLYTDPAWLYLTKNLAVGSTFDLRLVRTLADDVWLHGKVAAVYRDSHAYITDGRVVHYVVDYGLSTATDSNGQKLGYFRSATIGRVIFVPGIGPIGEYEESYSSTSTTLDGPFIRMDLQGIYPILYQRSAGAPLSAVVPRARR